MLPDKDFSAVIAEIRDKVDIAGFIAEYLPLKKRGRNYWGCCPFHNEKTPSFSVNAEKGMFYCFGCQTGGDIFGFLMKIENRTFIESARILAERAGVVIPERTQRDTLADRQRELVQTANKLAADFFHACLVKTAYGAEALSYLHGRGITGEIIDKFNIGFAPNVPDKLCHALRKRGIADEILFKSGLAVKSHRGKFMDAFRGRVMVPIVDLRGSVIAFGGRAIGDILPKYLNTPDTELFSKRSCLYALNIAQAESRRENALIITEGYFDAISLHAAGISNVVAGMGTALSSRQAALAAKNAATIYLCYDNDTAGKNAALRAYEVLKSTGAKIRVTDLADVKDPDEYVRKYGADSFRERCAAALPILDYAVDSFIVSMPDDTLDSRVAALEKILQFFTAYTQPLELEQSFSAVAARLKLDEKLIREEFSKLRGGSKRRNIENKIRSMVSDNVIQEAERQILKIFIENTVQRAVISKKMANFEFSSDKIKEFWQALYNIYSANDSFNVDDLLAREAENSILYELLPRILLKEAPYSDEQAGEVVARLFLHNQEQLLLKNIQMHIKKAGELEKAGSSEYIAELRSANELNAQLQQIRKYGPREGK